MVWREKSIGTLHSWNSWYGTVFILQYFSNLPINKTALTSEMLLHLPRLHSCWPLRPRRYRPRRRELLKQRVGPGTTCMHKFCNYCLHLSAVYTLEIFLKSFRCKSKVWWHRCRLRQPSQSPAVDAPEEVKYRTPPSTPFQPAFYKTPKDGLDLSEKKYRLPSQSKIKTSTEYRFRNVEVRGRIAGGGGRDDDSYDGDTEFWSCDDCDVVESVLS